MRVSMATAFVVIRHHARSTHQRLDRVAADLTTGRPDAEDPRWLR